MYFVVAIVCLIGAALLLGVACFVGSFIRWGSKEVLDAPAPDDRQWQKRFEQEHQR